MADRTPPTSKPESVVALMAAPPVEKSSAAATISRRARRRGSTRGEWPGTGGTATPRSRLPSPLHPLLCSGRPDGLHAPHPCAPCLAPPGNRPRHRRGGYGSGGPPPARAGSPGCCPGARRRGQTGPAPCASGGHPRDGPYRGAQPEPHAGPRLHGARGHRAPGRPRGARRRPVLHPHPRGRPGAGRARAPGRRVPFPVLAAGAGRRVPGAPLPHRAVRLPARGDRHPRRGPHLGVDPVLGLRGAPDGGARSFARRLGRRRAGLGRRLLPGRPGRRLAQARGRALRGRRAVPPPRRRPRHRVRGQGHRSQAALPLHRPVRLHRLLRRCRDERPPRLPQGARPLRAPHVALRQPSPPAPRLRPRPPGRRLRCARGHAGLGRGRRRRVAGGLERRVRPHRADPPPQRARLGLLPPLQGERSGRKPRGAATGGGTGGKHRTLHGPPPPLRHPARRVVREPAPAPAPARGPGEAGVARRLPHPDRRRPAAARPDADRAARLAGRPHRRASRCSSPLARARSGRSGSAPDQLARNAATRVRASSRRPSWASASAARTSAQGRKT